MSRGYYFEDDDINFYDDSLDEVCPYCGCWTDACVCDELLEQDVEQGY